MVIIVAMPRLLLMLSLIAFGPCFGQRTGGSSIFNFLSLSNSPQLSALGSINVSNISDDVAMGFSNPALLRPQMDRNLAVSFNSLYAGIKNYQLNGALVSLKLNTVFALGVSYFDYGSIPQTDASGNELGTFRPGDYVVQASSSRSYGARINYGATVKFISSNYGLYRSNGIALDAGFVYYDSSKKFQASVVMKNMGAQLKKYTGSAGDGLPFDLQAGVTKRLAEAPIQFSLTAHHLHQFDIKYRDTLFNNENDFTGSNSRGIDNIFRHFVLATQVFVGERIELTAAYNHLRRAELGIQNSANGLNGFSLGVGALFTKLQIRYSRAYYQGTSAYNHLGINLNFREFMFTKQ